MPSRRILASIAFASALYVTLIGWPGKSSGKLVGIIWTVSDAVYPIAEVSSGICTGSGVSFFPSLTPNETAAFSVDEGFSRFERGLAFSLIGLVISGFLGAGTAEGLGEDGGAIGSDFDADVFVGTVDCGLLL